MPVIHTHVSVSTTPGQREALKAAYGKAITAVPGKSEGWLMCPFEDNMPIYFGGDDSKPAAYVEVNVFGRSVPGSAWEKLTEQIMAALGKELGAVRVVSKAHKDIQAKFLMRNGADEVVYPDRDTAHKLAARLSAKNLFDYIEVSAEYAIAEIALPKEWEGKSLLELDVRKRCDVNVLAVRRAGSVGPMMPESRFETGDRVFLLGKQNVIGKLVGRAGK